MFTGRIVPLYSNNVQLLDMGAVEADNLSPWKARVLLIAALAHGTDPAALAEVFAR